MNVLVLSDRQVALLRMLKDAPANGLEALDVCLTVGVSRDELVALKAQGLLRSESVEPPFGGGTLAFLHLSETGQHALLHLPRIR